MSATESNRKAIKEMWRRLEAGLDWNVLDKYYDPAYVRNGDSGQLNRDAWYRQLQELYTAFPDHITDVPVTVAEGDYVVYRWTATARHLGQYQGAPPTGRSVTAEGITISRFRDGKIVEEQASWNKLAFLENLGISALRRRIPNT